MTIPTHRINDWIADTVGPECSIYAMPESGQRDLHHLALIRPMSEDWRIEVLRPRVILHDREPLDFTMYRNHYLRENLSRWWRQHRGDQADVCDYPQVLDFLSQHNLGFVSIADSIYDRSILIHSELSSPHVQLYERTGMLGVYWWSHAMIARDWFRYARYDSSLDTQHPRRLFNVYNRAWTGSREYRIKFTELLVMHDLEDSCELKFNAWDQGCHYQDHQFRNDAMRIDRSLDHLPPNTAQSWASADYAAADYRDSCFDVVLETLFDDMRLHLTEKVLRPIACGRPFVLAATAGSLELLRSYGFRTFASVINEDYDIEHDPVRRLEKICQVMQHICDRTVRQQRELYQEAQDIARYNQQHFFSQPFYDQVMQEFRHNWQQASQQLQQHRGAKKWSQFRRTLHASAPDHVLLRLRDRRALLDTFQAAVGTP